MKNMSATTMPSVSSSSITVTMGSWKEDDVYETCAAAHFQEFTLAIYRPPAQTIPRVSTMDGPRHGSNRYHM